MVDSMMGVTVVESVLVIGHRSTRIGPTMVAARKLQHDAGDDASGNCVRCLWPGRWQRKSGTAPIASVVETITSGGIFPWRRCGIAAVLVGDGNRCYRLQISSGHVADSVRLARKVGKIHQLEEGEENIYFTL